MMAPVVAVPRIGVPQACYEHQAQRVISIGAAEDGEQMKFPRRISVLRLKMSDIHCGKIWSDKNVAETVALGLTEPTDDHVQEALAFARAAPDEPLIVHCTAGISRSPAIALAILADRFGAGKEAQAVAKLFDQFDFMPNPGIIAIADRVLQRGGAIAAALAARPPKAEEVFSW